MEGRLPLAVCGTAPVLVDGKPEAGLFSPVVKEKEETVPGCLWETPGPPCFAGPLWAHGQQSQDDPLGLARCGDTQASVQTPRVQMESWTETSPPKGTQ